MRVILGSEYLGDLTVTVNVFGDILALEKGPFMALIRPKLSESGEREFKELPESFALSDLSALMERAEYNPATLTLLLRLAPQAMKAITTNWKSQIPDWAQNAQAPAPWSLALNTAFRQSFSYGDLYEGDKESVTYTSGDLAFQFKRWVLEASGSYDTERAQFERGDVRLVKDFPQSLSRLQIGDLLYPTMSLQSGLALGGIGISRETTLDPYRIITPLNDQEFYLSSRSLVKVYVNGQLVRSVFLPAGRHSLLDLPLNNGVNEIRLDIRDFYGEESSLTFKRFTSTKLLRAGFIEYSANVGFLRTLEGNDYHYDRNKDGAIFNGFWRRGINSVWTSGGFLLTSEERSQAGLENTLSTPFGIWSHEFASSRAPEVSDGFISRTEYTYQLSSLDGVGSRYQIAHEWYSKRYQNFLERESYQDREHVVRLASGFDLTSELNINLGYQHFFYRSGRTGLGADVSASLRFFDDWLLSAYHSRTLEANRRWSESYYFFLTWNIPESGQSLTASVDGQNKLQRLDWISSPQARFNSIESRGSVQNDESQLKADVRGSLMASRGQLNFEQAYTKDKYSHESFGTTTVGASFGLGIVPGGIAFGRPIQGSFAVVKPHPALEDATIGVGTSTMSEEAQVNSWGSALLPELTSYQYTMLSFDLRELDPGLSIGDESVVLYPGHRTGHLVTVGRAGKLMAQGRLYQMIAGKEVPVALKVGAVRSSTGQEMPFFTDRTGQFFLEELEGEDYVLLIEDLSTTLQLSKQKPGLIDVGSLEMR